MMEIPFWTGPINCLDHETFSSDEQAINTLHSIVPWNVNIKMYSGERLSVKDSFKMIKDDRYLYMELVFDSTSTKSPLHQSHVIYITCNEPTSDLYKISIHYNNSKSASVSFYPGEKKVTPKHDLVISPIPEGHKAFLKIPLQELDLNWSTFMINVVRVDWGFSPLASLFPVRSGFFIEDENGHVGISLLKDPTVFAHVRFVTKSFDSSIFLSQIKLESLGNNQRRLTLPKSLEDHPYTLTWETPSGQRLPLNYTVVHYDGHDTVDFSHPPVRDEGFYKLHLLQNQRYTILYINRKHLIKGMNNKETEALKCKTHVDCSKISEQAQKVLSIVPPFGGMRNTHDPRLPQLWTYGTFEYDFSNPQKIRSQKTGDLYPDPDFPETESIEFINRFGERIVYPFYRTPDGTRCFLSAALWAAQKTTVCSSLPNIAKKDPVGAAKILTKLSNRYRFYEPYSDYYRMKYPMDIQTGPPYPYYGGFWSNWFYADLSYVASIAEAYAIINQTDAFEQLSLEYQQDIASEVQNIIQEGLDFVFSYGIINTNMDASIWDGLIRIGMALEEPEYVHMALERIDYFIKHFYLFDGFFSEVTVSYHQMITNGVLRTLKKLSSYSDPIGYIYPGTGERMDTSDLTKRYSLLESAVAVPKTLQYPNGRTVTTQDSNSSFDPISSDTIYESLLYPAAKIARLTNNSKINPVQIIMNCQPKYGHNHWDCLNINLFALDVELLPDIGYTHTYNRKWATSTLAHNTVTVDGQECNHNPHGGNYERFMPEGSFTGVVRAADSGCYSQTQIYDREVVMVPIEDKQSSCYILDIFRVKGGNRHEYALNFNADHDTVTSMWPHPSSEQETMLPKGVPFTKPKEELYQGETSGHYHAYMYVQGVKTQELDNKPYSVVCTITQEPHQGKGVRILGNSTQGKLFLGKAPSLRLTRQTYKLDHNDTTDQYHMDKLVLRREGVDLESVFLHVFEPFEKDRQPMIHTVERLYPDGSSSLDVVAKVTSVGFVDYVFSAYHDDLSVSIDGIDFKGQFGALRIQDGKVLVAQAISGKLCFKGAVLDESKEIAGNLLGVLLKEHHDAVNGFVIDCKLSKNVQGQYMIVYHPDQTTHAYKIKKSFIEDGKTIVDLGEMEPGFTMEENLSSAMTHYPFLQWNGFTTFIIE